MASVSALFHDWRYGEDGTPNPDFVLNQPAAQGAEILVAGRNFGCGSSREHAPWALADYGFRAVLSTEIADIFRSNALKNGVLADRAGEGEHRYLLDHPGIELAIDVAGGFIELPDGGRFSFELDAFARECLLERRGSARIPVAARRRHRCVRAGTGGCVKTNGRDSRIRDSGYADVDHHDPESRIPNPVLFRRGTP